MLRGAGLSLSCYELLFVVIKKYPVIQSHRHPPGPERSINASLLLSPYWKTRRPWGRGWLQRQWRKYQKAVLFLVVMTSSLLTHLMTTSIAQYVFCRRKNRFLQDAIIGFAGSVSRNTFWTFCIEVCIAGFQCHAIQNRSKEKSKPFDR